MPLSPPLVHSPLADVPVLLSVPHAGRDYPEWLLKLSTGGRAALGPLEDPLVDELADPAIRSGIGAVVARAPRAAVDCNRAEDEIDPAVVATGPLPRLTARARGGLGIIPGRTVSHGPLWRQPIRRDELQDRLEQAHRPYHEAISDGLRAIAGRFGCALLLDCHSMPPLPDRLPSIVLGDKYGRTAAPWVTAGAVEIVRTAGFPAGVNDPFAGGHVIERHGAPALSVHALQIEIDRRCYLDGDRPGTGFERTAELITRLAYGLGELMLARGLPQAAE